MKKNITKVIFRTFKDDGAVIALFPSISATFNYLADCQSYMQIGQHSACSVYDITKGTRPSTQEEIKPLLKELKQIGYENIKQVFKFTEKCKEERKADAYREFYNK